GSFTTATSMAIVAATATTLTLQSGTTFNSPYTLDCLDSQWNQATGSYSAWLATGTFLSTGGGFDFANLSANPLGNTNVVNFYSALIYNLLSVLRMDAFLGKWSADGTPSLAVAALLQTTGGSLITSLAVSPSANQTKARVADPASMSPQ